MTDHPTQSDDDVRRLLEIDSSEPSAELDADIRAAARNALADESGGRATASRRRWPIPAVVGAAATVLLAVLVIDQVPQPTPEATTDAVERFAPPGRPASPPPSIPAQGDRSKSLRTVEEALSTQATGLRLVQGCSEPGNALRAAGMLVCVMEDHLEVRDVGAGDCSKALRLERKGGEVSIGLTEGGLQILLDGTAAWQVRCNDGAWQVEES